jgi:hypothetical protein
MSKNASRKLRGRASMSSVRAVPFGAGPDSRLEVLLTLEVLVAESVSFAVSEAVDAVDLVTWYLLRLNHLKWSPVVWRDDVCLRRLERGRGQLGIELALCDDRASQYHRHFDGLTAVRTYILT